MSSSAGLPPVSDQKLIISANLNSTLMLLYIMGGYIAIYPTSIYIYLSSRRGAGWNKHVVAGTLTALFLCLFMQIWIQWDYINDVFIRQGDSRLSSFVESVTVASFPLAITTLQLVLQNLGFLLADGLMIWRCYNACGRSFGKFFIPAILFVAEFGLTIADTTFISIFDFTPSLQTPEGARRANNISAALFCTVSATGLAATFIICFSIYSKTTESPRSRRRYQHIIDIMVQSSAIYTAFAIILMISDFLNTGKAISSINGLVLSNYVETLTLVTSGIGPTIMVARLAIASESAPENVSASSTVDLPHDLEKQFLPYGENTPVSTAEDTTGSRDDEGISEKSRNQEDSSRDSVKSGEKSV